MVPVAGVYLDLRRYWSEVTISVLEDLEKVRQRNVPNLPAASNLWDTAWRRGFDYLSSYKKYVSYGAEGFYPANRLDVTFGALTIRGDNPVLPNTTVERFFHAQVVREDARLRAVAC